jgi:hypothetical protein
LGNSLHIHGDQQNRRAHIGSGSGSFTARMSRTNYYYIVFFKHFSAKLIINPRTFLFHVEQKTTTLCGLQMFYVEHF